MPKYNEISKRFTYQFKIFTQIMNFKSIFKIFLRCKSRDYGNYIEQKIFCEEYKSKCVVNYVFMIVIFQNQFSVW